MKNPIITISILYMVISISCKEYPVADMAIINGNIVTIDTENPHAEAIAIKGEKILATGSLKEISKYIKDGVTKTIDAKGRLVLPGFNDAHVHFGPLDPDYIELRYTTDPAVITQKVREQVAKSKSGELISGGHWEHEMFIDKKWPAKELIDKVSPDNPVVLSRADGHSVLVNSYVLRASKITRDTPDPFGGEIQKDPVTGEPTGILKENAQTLIVTGEVKPERTAEELSERLTKGYKAAFQEAAMYGVTSVQIPGPADFAEYRKFLDSGELTVRVDIGNMLTDDTVQLKKDRDLANEYPREGDWIRFGYLKAFIDGTLGSGTALMFEPFDDNPGVTGLSMMPYDKFEKMVLEADKMGFQIGVHAIGDKGNNWVLNAYEKAIADNGKRDSRHRIEHAQLLRESDIPRFAQLGVIPSMQPTHCISDKKFCEKRIGEKRSAWAYAWKSLENSGARLAFGTDYQVEPLNPMEGLYAAVTRKERLGEAGNGWHPEQKLTMDEAIRFYTLGSAYSQFMETRKGMLRKGFLADIVILDKDLFSIDESQIMKTRPDYTITGGKVVYESGK